MLQELTYFDCSIVHDNLVVASFNKTAAEMLKLFASLDEQVTTGGWKLDRDSFSVVPSPDVEPGVPRAAMDGQEVQICMESSKNSIFIAMFDEI